VLTHCVFHATSEFKTKYRNPIQGVYDCYHCTQIVVKPSGSVAGLRDQKVSLEEKYMLALDDFWVRVISSFDYYKPSSLPSPTTSSWPSYPLLEPLFMVLDFLLHGMHIAFSRVELLFEGLVGSSSCPLQPFVICSVRLHLRSRLPPYRIFHLTSSGES
jgi:hypothetical protein